MAVAHACTISLPRGGVPARDRNEEFCISARHFSCRVEEVTKGIRQQEHVLRAHSVRRRVVLQERGGTRGQGRRCFSSSISPPSQSRPSHQGMGET